MFFLNRPHDLGNSSQLSYALHSFSHSREIVFFMETDHSIFHWYIVTNILWFSIICFMEAFCFINIDWIYLATLLDVTTMTSEQLELLYCNPEIFRRTNRYQNIRIIQNILTVMLITNQSIIDNFFFKWKRV